MVVALLAPNALWAHGTSNLGGKIEFVPADARPGMAVQLMVHVHELEPGALETLGEVSLRVGTGFENPPIALTSQSPGVYAASLILEEGKYNVRVMLDRIGGAKEIGMNGFVVTKEGIGLSEKDSELWFVPKGRYEPIPWLEHLSGVAVAVFGVMVVRRLSKKHIGIAGREKPWWILLLAMIAAVSMPLGAFWDIAQHSETGRESFFQPPHLLIYGGILLCIGVIAYSIGWRRDAGHSWRQHIMRDPATGTALIALVVQLASAPFDELWHGLFGLDVSVWSPPHTVLIFGGMAVCIALSTLAVSHFSLVTNVCRALMLAGALLIGEVFLAEFEFPMPAWHISQFRPEWAHPVLMILFAAIVTLMAKYVLTWRFGATLILALFLALRLLVGIFLAAIGMKALPVFPVWFPVLLVMGFLSDMLAQIASSANKLFSD